MILLQILDEGNITDSQGRKVDFKVCFQHPILHSSFGANAVHKNTIICLTSNLGSSVLAKEDSTFPDGMIKPDARDDVLALTQEYFPPELLNRLDATLVFNKLSRQSILSVVDLRLKDVEERIKDRRMTLDVDSAARQWLADRGYSDMYGARAIARVVRTEVLFPLAQKLLEGRIRNGDTVIVRVSADSQRLEFKDNHPPDPEIGQEAAAAPLMDSVHDHE